MRPRCSASRTEVGRVVHGGGVEGGSTVETVEGLAGARVRSLVVHAGDRDIPVQVVDGDFSARWQVDPSVAGVLHQPTFTLTLDDCSVLERVAAVR